MDIDELRTHVRALHDRGLSTNAIARELGVPRGKAAPLVRDLSRQQDASTSPPAVVGCWVTPGWSVGLTVAPDRDWPDQPEHGIEASGLVGVIVAREMRRPRDRVSVCGYLVDTYCLGVKDALGPRSMRRGGLDGFIDRFAAPFGGRPLPSDIELARHLVWGGVAYARELGLPPHADFRAAAGHLGALEEPCAIQFGHRGRPTYVQGPYDDADRILRALRRSVGPDGFGFTLVAGNVDATFVPV